MNNVKSFLKALASNPTVVKAAHTFWQAFLAALLVGIFAVHDLKGAQALLLAAIAAGASAVKSQLVARS